MKQRTVLVQRESKDQNMEKALAEDKKKLDAARAMLAQRSAALRAAGRRLVVARTAVVKADQRQSLKERAAKDKLSKIIAKLRARAKQLYLPTKGRVRQ